MNKLITLIILVGCSLTSNASHLLGGSMTAEHLGGDTYRITATMYRDCRLPNQGGGNPAAINADNPMFISIFDMAGNFIEFDSISSFNSTIIPAYSIEGCGINSETECINKIEFTFNKLLPNNSSGGYQIVSQRCCWAANFSNFANPGSSGQSLICDINTQELNNSAVFKKEPNFVQCINIRDEFDLSATDADGDSLSYSFCPVITGGNQNTPKPIVNNPPPYAPITYLSPYSGTQPYTHGLFSLDPQTGILSSQPTIQGRYLVGVCCDEWRNGVKINTVRRDIAISIINCSFNNRAIIGCDSITQSLSKGDFCLSNCAPENRSLQFKNKSIGGTSFLWNFGVTSSVTDTTTLREPSFTYPTNGDYEVTLTSYTNDCIDSTKVMVHIGDDNFSPTLSIDGNLCLGQEIIFTNTSSDTLHQAWIFEAPYNIYTSKAVAYTFISPGDKEIWLHAGNEKGCYNSTSQMINIADIVVKTIEDTIMPKGNQLQIETTGGSNYTWNYLSGNASVTLSNVNIGNPIAVADDYLFGVNTFIVTGTDAQGCAGKDTLIITSTEKAYVIVPNAFSPNGDGLNDYLSVLLSGYTFDLMKIYNRQGQCIFSSQSLNDKWDGTFKGQAQGIDAYYWFAVVRDRENKEIVFKGDVTIIR